MSLYRGRAQSVHPWIAEHNVDEAKTHVVFASRTEIICDLALGRPALNALRRVHYVRSDAALYVYDNPERLL